MPESPVIFPPAPEFLEDLQSRLRPRLEASLRMRGATDALAEDVASEILAECLLESDANLLRKFPGTDGLDNWLLRVAINRLISHQRRERHIVPMFDGCEPEPGTNGAGGDLEWPLGDLILRALKQAIGSLPASLRVLMWLRYGHGISQKRLCLCWRWHPTKLSRKLAVAREEVRLRTLAEIRRVEPGLRLDWEDIADVCAETNLFFPENTAKNPGRCV
jgi:DNA-directed RNA polymerase specialized sigma24 family protein